MMAKKSKTLYQCSVCGHKTFKWVGKFCENEIKEFQKNLFELGYKLQFVSLAGFHSLASSMYELAKNY